MEKNLLNLMVDVVQSTGANIERAAPTVETAKQLVTDLESFRNDVTKAINNTLMVSITHYEHLLELQNGKNTP